MTNINDLVNEIEMGCLFSDEGPVGAKHIGKVLSLVQRV